MDVAILGGTGPEGSGLAMRWASAGLSVVIGSRDAERAKAAAAQVKDVVDTAAVLGATNPEAAATAEVVVLTVPFEGQLPTLAIVRDALRPGSVLIDVTVPLATAVGGRPTRMLGVWEGSAAEQAAAAVPGAVSVVAAFHHLSAVHLKRIEHPVDSDILVCGDDRSAKDRVRPFVEAIAGARFVDAGPLSNARIVESITALLVGLNVRHKVRGAAIRITGLPTE
jgi:NADPH-dependent F420 reductase